MAAVPKRRISKARRNRRRSADKLSPIKTIKCKKCGKDKLSHRECPNCGSS